MTPKQITPVVLGKPPPVYAPLPQSRPKHTPSSSGPPVIGVEWAATVRVKVKVIKVNVKVKVKVKVRVKVKVKVNVKVKVKVTTPSIETQASCTGEVRVG